MSRDDLNISEFYGRIIASYTHEIRNILAVIRESAGLMQDIMGLIPENDMPHYDKLTNSLAAVERNVLRGHDLSTRLNEFAHSSDVETAETDLYQSIDMLASLCKKIAERQKVAIKVVQPDQPVILKTRPIELLLTVFMCVESLFSSTEKESEISVSIIQKDSTAQIIFSCSAIKPDVRSLEDHIASTAQWELIKKLCLIISGEIQIDDPEKKLCLLLNPGF